MKAIPEIVYPYFENTVIKDLDILFAEWYSFAKEKSFVCNYTADNIVFDGIFPYYSKQKVKILFIGREAVGIDGLNYIEVLYHAYKNNYIGDRHINQNRFHSLMFYIAYGLNNNIPAWQEIPVASELSKRFGEDGGISFAFMNLSKFSNESGRWSADWALIDSFVKAFENTRNNYFNDEICIINPDIIISMNLKNRLNALGEITLIESSEAFRKYKLNVQEKVVPIYDMFHFSAPGKSPKEKYYDVICEEAKNGKISHLE